MYYHIFSFQCYAPHRHLHSFPTRRSSDLSQGTWARAGANLLSKIVGQPRQNAYTDRKSTRLNSSHVAISYAVFCLKKKTITIPSRVSCSTRLIPQTSSRSLYSIPPSPPPL